MCVIIVDKKGGSLTEEQFIEYQTANSDGFGIMRIADPRTQPVKILGTLDEQLAAWNDFKDDPYILHLRIKTHGLIDLDNTHPYKMDGVGHLFHNGTITATADVLSKKKSDTWHFANFIMGPALKGNPELLKDPTFIKIIENFITFNKVVVFLENGQYHIFNEEKGEWLVKDDLWVSNTHALTSRKSAYTGSNWAPYTSNYSGSASKIVSQSASKFSVTPPLASGIVPDQITATEIAKMSVQQLFGLMIVIPEDVIEILGKVNFPNFDASALNNETSPMHAAVRIFTNYCVPANKAL